MLAARAMDYPSFGTIAFVDALSQSGTLSTDPPTKTAIPRAQVTVATGGWKMAAATTAPFEDEHTVLARDPLQHFGKYTVDDWDGYGAEPVTEQTIDSARLFLVLLPVDWREPDLAPGADGTIGLEWVMQRGPLKKLFVDVGPGATWSAYWRLASGERGERKRSSITKDTGPVLGQLIESLSA
jgi:hypothetical protein